MSQELGENVKNHRRQAGLSQVELANLAGLSPSTVAKVEQGGSSRMETLHMLARALRVETSALMSSAPPEPKEISDSHSLRVMELRKVLMPPLGFGDFEPAPDEEPNLDALHQVTRIVTRAYYEDDYGDISHRLPNLVRDVNSAVSYFDNGPQRERSLAIRIEALRTAGRFLTQVREHDLAYEALKGLITDAKSLGSDLDVASGVSGMCWLLLGQARFTESAELAVKTADKIEPRRLSKASPDHLAMWGWMNIRAISGAVRNNQYDLAEQAYRLANSAASAIGKEIAGQFQSGVTFGPVTAAMANLEIAMVKGDARTVLEKADTEELSFKARKLSGNPRPNSWYRHRLDIAKAHVKQGGYQEAALELKRMKGKAPTWLSHQRMAKDVMRDVQRKRKRTLTVEMREMAAFLGVDR